MARGEGRLTSHDGIIQSCFVLNFLLQDGPPTSYKYGYKAIYKGYNSIYNY